MKLKQRLVMFGTMFIVMIVIFMTGMSISSVNEQLAQSQAIEKETPATVHPSKAPDDAAVVPVVPNLEALNKNSRLLLPPLARPDIGHFPVRRKEDPRLQREEQARLPLHVVPLNDSVVDHSLGVVIPSDGIHSNRMAQEVFVDSVHPDVTKQDPWKIWKNWVRPDFLYPEGGFWSDEMSHILHSMATAPVTSLGLGHRGTQLKASMMLGSQRTAFKPMRYPRDEVIEGDPYAGYDRHNAEIAGFHLDGILDFRISPPVVGRRINLASLHSVTSDKLLATYFEKAGNTCFYGKCYYCKKAEAACAEGEVMEGAVSLWLPDWYELKTWRSPYQRTYRQGYKAKWEVDDNFCLKLLNPKSEYYHGILELTDASIYDFLMGNADRHHYETYAKAPHHGRIMHIDNGKSFGNPYNDELSILAPLKQCCRVKESTWQRLQQLRSSEEEGPLSRVLEASMRRDPLHPILTPPHLAAIDRRHAIIISAVEQCIEENDESTVIVKHWG